MFRPFRARVITFRYLGWHVAAPSGRNQKKRSFKTLDQGLFIDGWFLASLFLELVHFPLELAQTTEERVDV